MAEKFTKSKRFKLITGIAIPVMVLVIAIVMVGASFAWFSSKIVTSVQSIQFSVEDAFILSFSSENDTGTRNINYKGQNAIDSNGRLRTEYNGKKYGGFGTSASLLEQYMIDSPYYFITTVKMDTVQSYVDIDMILDTAKILTGDRTLNSYDGGNGGFSVSDIPYAFTWYFKAHDAEKVNYIGDSVQDGNSVMNYRLPANGEVWYTPYGTLTFDGEHMVKEANGIAVQSDYSILDEGLKSISRLYADNADFDFYIVFAPQQLFWAQFCASDRDKTVSDLYDEDELIKVFGESSENQMYYSNTGYSGATFEFGAMINATAIYKQ